jgi:hypothetical protein
MENKNKGYTLSYAYVGIIGAMRMTDSHNPGPKQTPSTMSDASFSYTKRGNYIVHSSKRNEGIKPGCIDMVPQHSKQKCMPLRHVQQIIQIPAIKVEAYIF